MNLTDAVIFRRKLLAWFKEAGRDLPWRRTDDPYAIFVSEMMLQQTQVATVLDYYRRWMERFPSFEVLAAASETEVLHAWQGLGYYSRARRLHQAAQQIVQKHAGRCPRTPEEIRKLPGVGPYTAGAVASFAFDLATPIVDANIARVLARLFDSRLPIDSATGNAFLWKAAAALLPPRSGRLHNSALMELGALVCTPRNPACETCPVQSFCSASEPASLPVKKTRPKMVLLHEQAALILDNGQILLEQETASRWRGLWRLPVPEKTPEGKALLRIQYPFTHHKVTLTIFRGARRKSLSAHQRWFPVAELENVPLPAPYRRALRRLLP